MLYNLKNEKCAYFEVCHRTVIFNQKPDTEWNFYSSGKNVWRPRTPHHQCLPGVAPWKYLLSLSFEPISHLCSMKTRFPLHSVCLEQTPFSKSLLHKIPTNRFWETVNQPGLTFCLFTRAGHGAVGTRKWFCFHSTAVPTTKWWGFYQ